MVDVWKDYLHRSIPAAPKVEPCLCDVTDDGMKFVNRDECPRHGTPGKIWGEGIDKDDSQG